MYRVAFYVTASGRSPVEEFLDSLSPKERHRVVEILAMLQEEGPSLRRPYADHVRGPLRELRVQLGRNRYRLFHFFVPENVAMILHAFAKKTQRLPEREIRTAEERMLEIRNRISRGESL